MKSLRWKILYGFAGIVDAAQILFGATGFGLAVSAFLEVITGPVIVILCIIFKISILTNPKRLASLFLIAGTDTLTGGFAPFWVVDIYYIHQSVKKEEAQSDAQQEQDTALSNSIRQPLYKDGIRQPPSQEIPLRQHINNNGIRSPNGGLVK